MTAVLSLTSPPLTDRLGEAAPAARAAAFSARVADAGATDVLRAAFEEFKGRIALVSSFGAESASLLHLVASVDAATPVIFLDTGKHFAQTLAYRRTLAETLGLKNVLDVQPAEGDLRAGDPDGKLWSTDPDACCALRKVRPLHSALAGFDAWISGRKQFQSAGRARLPKVELAPPHSKINPIAEWSREDVAAYAVKHELPAHPLVADGYPSIGCWPCTAPSDDPSDPRAGRWTGRAKTECGIHLRAVT
ncbi:MAG: phosphoadenylyl-sulfate reductase [Pseudomonadota bacterium]